MADGVGSFENLIAGLSGNRATPSGGIPMSERKEKSMTDKKSQPAVDEPVITFEMIESDHPEIAEKFRQQGADKSEASYDAAMKAAVDEATGAERSRILGIQAAALPGHENLVATLIEDGASLGDAATQILAAEKETGARMLQKRSESLKATEGVDPIPTEQGAPDEGIVDEEGEGEADDAVLLARWRKDPSLRAEYNNDRKAYLAVEGGVASGSVTVQ